MYKLILLILSLGLALPLSAQHRLSSPPFWGELEGGFSLTVGTTGLGFDFTSPVYHDFRLRLGAAWMPRFERAMHFDVQVGDEPEDKYDAKGNRITTKFDRLATHLEEVTGFRIDQQVDMIGRPTYSNIHLLVDYMPFRNKHWYLTAGIFYGSSIVAEAVNSLQDAPTLVSVNYYNNAYDKILEGEPLAEVGNTVIYLDAEIEDRFIRYGRMGINIGDYVEPGKGRYMMEPDKDATLSAVFRVNRWKPYVGFGYDGRLIRGDDRYLIGFDCGAMFWGGTPDVLTHDGTNLTKDVEHIRGGVGDYVSIAKAFKVMPVLNLKLTRRITF